ncbi:MAG: hypothetical protein MZU97_19935 [Bacillus subtilis]|nr:hypothetical protein [Bacillus subtilis]
MFWCGQGYANADTGDAGSPFSDDLLEWPKPELLMQGKYWWEAEEDRRVLSAPIKTPVRLVPHLPRRLQEDDGYRVGAVLLDLNDPRKILARTKEPIMVPEFDFEVKGFYNGCVFPTGNVVKDGVLYVYYGAADKYVCVATADFASASWIIMTSRVSR